MTVPMADVARVGALMSRHPVTIGPNQLVSEAEDLLKTYRVGGLPVCDGDDLVGVLSQTDVGSARSNPLLAEHWHRLRVQHVMTSPAITVHADATLAWAARQMLDRHIHRLVVIGDDGRPIGIVTPLDLLRAVVSAPDVRLA